MKMLLILFLLCLTSCVSGPNSERKNPLNYLNGEHYRQSPTGGGDQLVLPILKRKDKLTMISGQTVLKSGILVTPVRHAKIELFDSNKKMVATTTSNNMGEYQLSGRLKNGSYSINVETKSLQLSRSLSIDRYKIEGLIFYLQPKKQ